MSSTYWKQEILRYAVWLRRCEDEDSLFTFKESVDNMRRAIYKYDKSKYTGRNNDSN